MNHRRHFSSFEEEYPDDKRQGEVVCEAKVWSDRHPGFISESLGGVEIYAAVAFWIGLCEKRLSLRSASLVRPGS